MDTLLLNCLTLDINAKNCMNLTTKLLVNVHNFDIFKLNLTSAYPRLIL